MREFIERWYKGGMGFVFIWFFLIALNMVSCYKVTGPEMAPAGEIPPPWDAFEDHYPNSGP